MIKSEIITHEGSPGPNWLDHCRDVFTPQIIGLLILVALAAAIIIGFHDRHGNLSQQTGILSPGAASNGQVSQRLQVLPPDAGSLAGDSTATSAAAGASLQPADSSGDSADAGAATSDQGSGNVGPAPSDSASRLQNGTTKVNHPAQTALPAVQGTVDGVVNGVGGAVGGLGL